jgi:type II secretory pathway pseudopilin PulG
MTLRHQIRSRARLADESGVAMIIAVVALMAIGILISAAFAVALQTNGSSRSDANKINALEAAEAGLQVATYRLNMLYPNDSNCVGDAVSAPNANNECISSSYTLGNGASYQFITTPTLPASTSNCIGYALASSNYAQRCITAIGTSNGVQMRAQIRVATFSAIPLFPYAGITAINQLNNGNNASINGYEATNGVLTLNNGVAFSGCELGPGGSMTGQGAYGICTQLTSPIVLDPVDPGTSNLKLSTGACAAPPGGEAAFQGTWCNDDYRITNGIADPSGHTTPEDPSSGISFDPVNRILSVSHPNATLTLTGGVYNFCEFDAPNNATINIAAGVNTEIIIDSPDDPGSGCPATCPAGSSCAGQKSGNLNLNNNVTWLNASQNPLALQIFVYGYNDGSGTVNFANNTAFWGLLYAPKSTLNMSNSSTNSTFWGAISGRIVNVSNNFHFQWYQSAGGLQARATGVYYRTAWSQCTPTASSSDPASGCG